MKRCVCTPRGSKKKLKKRGGGVQEEKKRVCTPRKPRKKLKKRGSGVQEREKV